VLFPAELDETCGELDSAVLFNLLVGLLGREEGSEQQPQHEGGDGDHGNCREDLAEMKGHMLERWLAEVTTVANSPHLINLG
jgi:hypothetical protein